MKPEEYPSETFCKNTNIVTGVLENFERIQFKIKLCWKTRPLVIFGLFFGTKRWKTFERKKISKIANIVLEKRQRRGSVPNFKTRALAIWKLKGKENCENERRETPVLCTTLYRKPMQPCNFDGILYTNFATEFFHTVFTRRSVLKGTLRRDQKVIFVKSPISSPIVMPL